MVLASLLVLPCVPLLTVNASSIPPIGQEEPDKPVIVCSTSVFSSIVEDMVGDTCYVITIVPPGMCPGHYDVKPSDVYAVQVADLIFYHGFEQWMEDLIESTGTNATVVKVGGNWNTPDEAKYYMSCVVGNLSLVLGADYNSTLTAMLNAVDAVAEEILQEAEQRGVSSVNVICMQWQEPFVSWVGFNVVDTYGPPELVSTQKIAELVSVGTEQEAKLVIDNLQSGTWLGDQVADEIGAVHVVLTNFPDSIPEAGNLTEMFKYNAEQLFDGLDLWEELHATPAPLEPLVVLASLVVAVAAIAAGRIKACRAR